MNYVLEFYSGTVQDEILAWPDGIQASFTRIAEQMTEHGPNLGMPYTRAFGEGLFEIRAKGREGIGRAFFCMRIGRRVVILHRHPLLTSARKARLYTPWEVIRLLARAVCSGGRSLRSREAAHLWYDGRR